MDIDVERFLEIAGSIGAGRPPELVQAKIMALVPVAPPAPRGREGVHGAPWQSGWPVGAAPPKPLRLAGVRFRRLA